MKTALAVGFWNEAKFRDKVCEKFARSGSFSLILPTQHRTTQGVQKFIIILKIYWFSWYEQPLIFGQWMKFYHKHFVGEGDYSYTFMPIQCVVCKCTTRGINQNNIDLRVTISVLGP